MIKVLDLCSGTQSVRKALEEKYNIVAWLYSNIGGLKQYYGWDQENTDKKGNHTIEYVGIDIYSPELGAFNTILDLTQDNIVEKIKDVLGNWKPDFIWASPVCNTFSNACAYKGGNIYFEVDKEKGIIKPREKMDDINNKKYKDLSRLQIYQERAKKALKLHDNCRKIIDYFNVQFVIEQPRTARSKYLYKDLVSNYTTYCMYGFDYKKPTTIYSNVKIDLKLCDHKKHLKQIGGIKQGVKTYKEKSSVPPLLIKDIIKQLLRRHNGH